MDLDLLLYTVGDCELNETESKILESQNRSLQQKTDNLL